MKKITPVISYDPNKVYTLGQSVIKVTNERELLNSKILRDFIKNQKLLIPSFGMFTIKIPEFELFDCKKLKMEFCHGETLEKLLKNHNSSSRKNLLGIIGALFRWFFNNFIVWHDFAPRNIIIDFYKKVIVFVDFERSIMTTNGKIDEAEYCFYLSDIIAEEWGAFLTTDEFNHLLPYFWDKAKEVNKYPINLTSKRKLAIARILCLEKTVTAKDVVFISRAMQEISQAKIVNNLFIFPLITIERLTKKLGPNYYAQLIVRFIKYI